MEPQRMHGEWEKARGTHRETRELLDLFRRVPDIDAEGAEELLMRSWRNAYRGGYQGGEEAVWSQTTESGRLSRDTQG